MSMRMTLYSCIKPIAQCHENINIIVLILVVADCCSVSMLPLGSVWLTSDRFLFQLHITLNFTLQFHKS